MAGATGGGASTGTLVLEGGVTLQLVGGGLYMGTDFYATTPSRTKSRTGIVSLESNSHLNLGSSTLRSDLVVGWMNTDGPGSDYSATASGLIRANTTNGGGYLSGYLNKLEVGISTGSPWRNATHAADGKIDLNGMQGALIDTRTLLVGSGLSAAATGLIDLGSHAAGAFQLIVSEEVKVGIGGPSSATGALNADTIVSGTVTWGDNVSVRFGSQEQRVAAQIGVSSLTRSTNNAVSGAVVGTGGTFSGYFSSLVVGAQNATAASKTYQSTGVLDLRQVAVEHFSVSGNTDIGYGTGAGSKGRVYLADTEASFGGNVRVGSSDTTNGEGLLGLKNTVAAVGGDFTIHASGSVEVIVDGSSSGIYLSEESAFTLDLGGLYSISFSEPLNRTTPYFGLAWEGDKVSYPESLVAAGAIVWSGLEAEGIGIFYDLNTNTTYIGLDAIPEPGGAGLAIVAALTLGAIRVRNGKKGHRI